MNNSDDDFDEFAVVAWPRLRWAAYLLTSDHHLAEDLAQTALARTYSAWGRVRHRDATAYTRKVLVNLNIDRLRRRRFREVGEGHLDEHPTVPDQSLEDRSELLQMLSNLTVKERRVVLLRHYFDLSEAAVADELGVATGTVKSTLARALAKLRAAAADQASHEVDAGSTGTDTNTVTNTDAGTARLGAGTNKSGEHR